MHIPVLLNEMVDHLSVKDGGVYIDATFGGGGYASAILEKKNCSVIAFDKDPDAISRGIELKNKYGSRLTLIEAPFHTIKDHITERVDGIVFDFGVSSFQLDIAERGFSFKKDGPLDMRMTKTGQSAYDVVNTFSEKDLSDIIYFYGEEDRARAIARAIVNDRKIKPYETTFELAGLVRRVVKRKDDIDLATKTFQALRIFVNDELIEIKGALSSCPLFLKPDATLVGVTFHSLEDRLLKQFLSNGSFHCVSKAIKPTSDEVKANPRSRSAKLRSAKLMKERMVNHD
ncbi:MAG: 16S rRNA (cytosine(1402)-N(4))-methyltransferase RsmH [Proteobacteria bacterium]|nr:16S rRNA (cytosine(1402)-N(4))-methyltransferase RsmH [Pseudomonadota bacterium]